MPNLILERRLRETIVINNEITVTPINFRHGKVRLAIEAPASMNIRRGELPPRDEPDSMFPASPSVGSLVTARELVECGNSGGPSV